MVESLKSTTKVLPTAETPVLRRLPARTATVQVAQSVVLDKRPAPLASGSAPSRLRLRATSAAALTKSVAKLGVSGALMEAPFAGWQFKDGEAKADETVGHLVAGAGGWIAFEAGMRLASKAGARRGPLGLAVSVAGGMVSAGIFDRLLGKPVAHAVAGVVPNKIAQPIAETLGKGAEVLDRFVWEPIVAPVVRPIFAKMGDHPVAATGLALVAAFGLRGRMPKLSGFIGGSVLGIAGVKATHVLPELGKQAPPAAPLSGRAAFAAGYEQANRLSDSGRDSAFRTLIARGGGTFATDREAAQMLNRLFTGYVSDADQEAVVTLTRSLAGDSEDRLATLAPVLRKNLDRLSWDARREVASTLHGRLADAGGSGMTPAAAQALFRAGKYEDLIGRSGHRHLEAPAQATLLGRLSKGVMMGTDQRMAVQVLDDAARDHRLDAVLRDLNASGRTGPLLDGLLDMRQSAVLSLVLDDSQVAPETLQAFVSQVRAGAVKEHLGMEKSDLVAYSKLRTAFHGEGAQGALNTHLTEVRALLPRLSPGMVKSFCLEAMTGLDVPGRLALLRAIPSALAADIGAPEAIAKLEALTDAEKPR